MMRNIDVAINGYSLERAEWIQMQYPPTRDYNAKAEYAKSLNRILDGTIGLFEGVSIERRSLHIRFLRCYPSLLGSTHFSTICQRLKTLVGFRTVTIEVLLGQEYNDAKEITRGRELVPCITQALTKELQPAFGPAISAFNFSADTPPTTKHSLVDEGDLASVGSLKFHPVKQSVNKHAIEKD